MSKGRRKRSDNQQEAFKSFSRALNLNLIVDSVPMPIFVVVFLLSGLIAVPLISVVLIVVIVISSAKVASARHLVNQNRRSISALIPTAQTVRAILSMAGTRSFDPKYTLRFLSKLEIRNSWLNLVRNKWLLPSALSLQIIALFATSTIFPEYYAASLLLSYMFVMIFLLLRTTLGALWVLDFKILECYWSMFALYSHPSYSGRYQPGKEINEKETRGIVVGLQDSMEYNLSKYLPLLGYADYGPFISTLTLASEIGSIEEREIASDLAISFLENRNRPRAWLRAEVPKAYKHLGDISQLRERLGFLVKRRIELRPKTLWSRVETLVGYIITLGPLVAPWLQSMVHL